MSHVEDGFATPEVAPVTQEFAEFLPEDQPKLLWVLKRFGAGALLGAIAASGYAGARAIDDTLITEQIAGLNTTANFTHGDSEAILGGRPVYIEEDRMIFGSFRIGLEIDASTLPTNPAAVFGLTESPEKAAEGYESELSHAYIGKLEQELEILCGLSALVFGGANTLGAVGARWYTHNKTERERENLKIAALEATTANLAGRLEELTKFNQRLVAAIDDPAERQRVASEAGQQNNKDLEHLGLPQDGTIEHTSEQSPGERHRRFRAFARKAAATTVAMTVSIGAGTAKWEASKSDESHPDRHVAISALDGTSYEGKAYVGNSDDAAAINTYYGYYRTFVDGQDAERETFVREATDSLNSPVNIAKIAVPSEDEEAILMGSDLHAKRAMIEMATRVVQLLNAHYEAAEHDKIKLVLFAGDNGYGIPFDKDAIEAQGQIGDGASEATGIGNHDRETPTFDQLRDANVQIVDGKVVNIAGIPVVSVEDPQETPFLGQVYLRDGKPDTPESALAEEQASGDTLDDLATKAGDMPIGMPHEGYAAAAALDLPEVSRGEVQQQLTDWFAARGSSTLPWEDGVRDLPFNLLVYGHWHRIIHPRTVYNSDGTWTEVMELNTMGGAIADNSIGHFDTPIGSIGQTASFPIIFRNNDTGLITGYQMLTFRTDGVVIIHRRQNIGNQIDPGQPYPTLGARHADQEDSRSDQAQRAGHVTADLGR